MFVNGLCSGGIIRGFIKIVLLISIVVLGIVVGINSFSKKEYVWQNVVTERTEQSFTSRQKKVREKKDYASFLETIQERPLFASVASEAAAPVPGISRQDFNKIVENLRLVGIITEEPQRAIIEDKTTGKTLYLQKEDVISGNLKIQEIKKDSVIVICDGETFEIHL